MAGKKKDIYTYVKECADCGSKNIRVPASYVSRDGSVRRYRECLDCGYKFTTVEVEECVSDVSYLLKENSVLAVNLEQAMKRMTELNTQVDCLTRQRDELLALYTKAPKELSDQLTDEELTQNFVNNCRYFCDKKGMPIGEFEKGIGVSVEYLTKCAERNFNVKIRTIYRASVVLGVPISRLLSPREEEN